MEYSNKLRIIRYKFCITSDEPDSEINESTNKIGLGTLYINYSKPLTNDEIDDLLLKEISHRLEKDNYYLDPERININITGDRLTNLYSPIEFNNNWSYKYIIYPIPIIFTSIIGGYFIYKWLINNSDVNIVRT